VNAFQNGLLFLMFVDYTKAFDMMSHSKLYKMLLDMGRPNHFVALVVARLSPSARVSNKDATITFTSCRMHCTC